jgi:hypothetical protein
MSQAISLVPAAGHGRSDLRAVAHRLPRRVAGAVHLPGDPGYDVERRSLSPADRPAPRRRGRGERPGRCARGRRRRPLCPS